MAEKTKAELKAEIVELKAKQAEPKELNLVEMVTAAHDELQKNDHVHNVHVAVLALRKALRYLAK